MSDHERTVTNESQLSKLRVAKAQGMISLHRNLENYSHMEASLGYSTSFSVKNSKSVKSAKIKSLIGSQRKRHSINIESPPMQKPKPNKIR